MKRLALALLLLTAVASGIILLARLGAEASPATFTVNSTGDGGDSNTGDGVCDDGSGNCTLRAAIEQANADAGTDTIAFNIPGAGPHTISPGSALPTITDPVTIDGTSEPDFAGTPIIELDGSGAGALVDGLNITAGSSTVRGLVINRFGGDGIELSTNGGNTIEGNYIGTDVSGTLDRGNTRTGVYIVSGANNTIGGTTAGARNVISANWIGVDIYGPATGNQVQGNYIGTDVNGSADLGNDLGVRISHAPSNTIGGTAAGAGNVISGNGDPSNCSYGVYISGSGATGNQLQGNYIGTDVNGTADLGNCYHGVFIWDAPSNTIGGTTAAERNVISGNDQDGVRIYGSGATGNQVQGNYIGTDVTGTADLGNFLDGVYISAPGNTIGGATAGAGNVISGNGQHGVEIFSTGATGNQVQGNYIGTDVTGTADLGNSLDGVYIASAPSNTIGGTIAAERNVISGNDRFGVWIVDSAATGNQVQGNYMGTDVTGTADVGNSNAGVSIRDAPNNTIGGTTEGARNVISGNYHGVLIYFAGATGNQVLGNYIGTDVNGTADLGNSQSGVYIHSGAGNNTIGGTTAGAGNLISGNDSEGVEISGTEATGNLVQGNLIGTDINGTAALGNSNDGVYINGAPGNTIGGTVAGAGNVISGNNNYGVHIVGSGATGNQVQGNYIGTDKNGTAALGNSWHGVYIYEAPSNIIGGTTEGARNVISGNGTRGIEISGSGATGNQVQGNYIGTDKNGTAALGNSDHGVYIIGAPNNTVGGTMAGARNVISGNNSRGVWIIGSGATGNQVQGNYIGTDATGTAALGNSGSGVEISGSASSNTIGGTAAGAGNVISGNNWDGVFISGIGTTGNQVQGNYIGTDVAGTADLGNAQSGVLIAGSNNTIGGTTAGAGNVIAYNTGDGVRVDGGATTGNTIRGNSIHSNGAKGIENINGGNTELPPPVIDSVGSASGHTDPKCYPCTVEVFSDDEDEGRIYHGSTITNDDATGTWVYPGLMTGPNVTATITDASGNTSEFSQPASCGTDTDGDGLGDNCDPDDDNDGYWDDEETAKGSLPLVVDSTPEHCDGADNDGDTETDEGYDRDPANGTPDCLEHAGPDMDADGFSDTAERWMSTDELAGCVTTYGTDAWPLDMDQDGDSDTSDVLSYAGMVAPPTGSADVDYNRRLDLDADSDIDTSDVLMYAGLVAPPTPCT